MNLVETRKHPSRAEILMALPVGEEVHVPYSKANSFRTTISRDIKDSSTMEFETQKVEIKKGRKLEKYLKIKRVA